jgi:hypothetical protein
VSLRRSRPRTVEGQCTRLSSGSADEDTRRSVGATDTQAVVAIRRWGVVGRCVGESNQKGGTSVHKLENHEKMRVFRYVSGRAMDYNILF